MVDTADALSTQFNRVLYDALNGRSSTNEAGRPITDDKVGISHDEAVVIDRLATEQGTVPAYVKEGLKQAVWAAGPELSSSWQKRFHQLLALDGLDYEIPFHDPGVIEGHSLTETRRDALETFATALIGPKSKRQIAANEELLADNITGARSLADIARVRFPENAWQGRDLAHPARLSAAVQQVRDVATFLTDLYVDSGGGRGLPFTRIDIVPASTMDDRHLRLEGKRLIIGMKDLDLWGAPKKLWSHGPNRLRKKWRAGDMFDFPKGKAGIGAKIAWRVFDPAGTIRNGLLKSVRETAEAVRERVQDMRERRSGMSDRQLRAQAHDLVTDSVNSDFQSAGQTLSARATAAIAEMARPQLEELLDTWQDLMNDPNRQNQAADGPLAAFINPTTKDTKIKVRMRGIIAVGNVHDVDVSAFAGSVSHGMGKYVTAAPEDFQLDADIVAPIAVYTVDKINVDALFAKFAHRASSRLLETATLDAAMQKLGI